MGRTALATLGVAFGSQAESLLGAPGGLGRYIGAKREFRHLTKSSHIDVHGIYSWRRRATSAAVMADGAAPKRAVT